MRDPDALPLACTRVLGCHSLHMREQGISVLHFCSHCDAAMKLLSVIFLCFAVSCAALMSKADSSHMVGGFKAVDHSNDEGMQKVSVLALCSL